MDNVLAVKDGSAHIALHCNVSLDVFPVNAPHGNLVESSLNPISTGGCFHPWPENVSELQ